MCTRVRAGMLATSRALGPLKKYIATAQAGGRRGRKQRSMCAGNTTMVITFNDRSWTTFLHLILSVDQLLRWKPQIGEKLNKPDGAMHMPQLKYFGDHNFNIYCLRNQNKYFCRTSYTGTHPRQERTNKHGRCILLFLQTK